MQCKIGSISVGEYELTFIIIKLGGSLLICRPVQSELRLPRWLSGKESACQCRRRKKCGFSPWVRKITWVGSGNLLQYSCLAWTEGPGGQQSMGLKESDTAEMHARTGWAEGWETWPQCTTLGMRTLIALTFWLSEDGPGNPSLPSFAVELLSL